MRNKIAAFLVLVFLVSCSSREKEKNHSQASSYFSSGTDALILKNYTQALQHLLKANELDPGNPEILNNLGMAFYFKKDISQALHYIGEALKENPKNSDARGNYASLLMEQGKIQEAEKQYQIVLKDLTYAKQTRTYYNLAVIELKRRDLSKAKTYFEKSLIEDESYCPSHMQLGHLSFKNRDFKNALTHYQSAGKGVCVSDPTPVYYQALTLIELHEFTKARLKLDEIDSRFSTHRYGAMARTKKSELRHIEEQYRAQKLNAVQGAETATPSF
jgi:type IV pilus assembly protein PilF